MPYLKSVLEVYELVLQKSTDYSGNAASKVKQEIIHGLGNTSISLNIVESFIFYFCDLLGSV